MGLSGVNQVLVFRIEILVLDQVDYHVARLVQLWKRSKSASNECLRQLR
jgi:hypothetical protein